MENASFIRSLWPDRKADLIVFIYTVVCVVIYGASSILISLFVEDMPRRSTLLIICLAGVGTLLLFPAIRIANSVFNIEEMSRKAARTRVSVEKYNDTKAVSTFVNNHRHERTTIFLGFADPALVHHLLGVLNVDPQAICRFYVNPGVLEVMMEDALFTSNLLADTNIYVVDCPRESCVVFALQKDTLHCIHARYRPVEGGSCWTVEPEPSSQFAQYLRDTFARYYEGDVVPVHLESVAVARFLYKVHEDRLKKNKSFFGSKQMPFQFRGRGYDFASSLLGHAQQTVLAIDFMLPDEWAGLLNYQQAHRDAAEKVAYEGQQRAEGDPGATAPKRLDMQRIHIYDKKNLGAYDYWGYVEMQRELGVDLTFINQERVKDIIKSPGQGFVVIDDDVVFASNEGMGSQECACLKFHKSDVEECKRIFNAIKRLNPVAVVEEEDIDKLP